MKMLIKKLNIFAVIGCLFKHSGSWKQIGIAYNGFGETLHKRKCIKCGKVQSKVF